MGDEKRGLNQVNYNALDDAKSAFIEASKKTLTFAKKFGFVPDGRLGSSANVFSLDLKPFLKKGYQNLNISLLPECLGSADEARPDDLKKEELEKFWYNIAFKTVAAMTNDVASGGMQPILISLYLPSNSPELVFDETFRKGFLSGFVHACKKVGCVYISGETPQLKTKIFKDKLDVSGAVFGLIPPEQYPIDGSSLKAGDKIVFIESSGPHENGFTALRKLAEKLKVGYRTKLPNGKEYWEAINAPSVLYTPLIQDIISHGVQPTNIEPITGHGWQKLMRPAIPLRYVIERMLPVPEIFKFVEQQSNTTPYEMIKIFNYGVGLAIYVHGEKNSEKIVKIAKKHKLNALVAGHIEESEKREVVVRPLDIVLKGEGFSLKK